MEILTVEHLISINPVTRLYEGEVIELEGDMYLVVEVSYDKTRLKKLE